jgi:hypothetical protein
VNLPLETIDVWVVQDEFLPSLFLSALPELLQPGDIIAFGAYSPSSRLSDKMVALGATEVDIGKVYNGTFELNRREHPNGRAFELIMHSALVTALVAEAQRMDGQDDKALFFDHVVAYRRGNPVVPLLCFHDAFSGGELHLSGLYSEPAVMGFVRTLPSAHRRERNPENYR